MTRTMKEHDVAQEKERHGRHRGNTREDGKRGDFHLPIGSVALQHGQAAEDAGTRTALLHEEGTDTVQGGIESPNVGGPIAVDESSLEGEEARKELREVGEEVASKDGEEREEES